MPPPDVPIAITSWAAATVFGDLGVTNALLDDGRAIDDHARVHTPCDRRRAAQLALSTAGRAAHGKVDAAAAVIVGTSKGDVEEWFSPPTSDKPSQGLGPAGLGAIAAEVSRYLGTRGPVLTFSAACASGLHALIRAAMMIRAGEVRQAVVVAAEASVHPLFLGSFERLGVMARPGAGCRPFDRNRTGFYMSEAGAAVLLEAGKPGRVNGGEVFVERFALAGDATHLTSNDADGRVLRHVLARVLDDRPVDLVHAHGTGTVMNDAVELVAIDDTVRPGGGAPPVVYSHKGALGHSLGASGLLSVVLNCSCHAYGRIPPNSRTPDPLPTRRVTVPQAVTVRAVRRSVAIASGFGGPVAAVSLTST